MKPMVSVIPLSPDDCERFALRPDELALFMDKATDDEWRSAVGDLAVVQTSGTCANPAVHEAHTFTSNVYATHISGWHCSGVYSACTNCDDRWCMSCVLRVLHDNCADDCPMCCTDGVAPEPLSDQERDRLLGLPRAYADALYPCYFEPVA